MRTSPASRQDNDTAGVALAANETGVLPLSDSHAGAGGIAVTVLFSAATFLGAFLLFLVQPLIAKYILPWFGGGAAVWATCMLFFQTVLLAGYLYAHLGVSRLRPRAQAAVHVVLLLAAAALALPAITPSTHWQPTAEAAGANPTWRILLLLAATVGVPCLALAATSPLLHSWYSRIRPGAAVYRLFALSNLGSMLALLAYPFVVEPLLPRRTQAIAWSAALATFAALCAACAWLAARHAPPQAARGFAPSSTDALQSATSQVALGKGTSVIFWLALPACASALLLGTTNAITHDFAPIPFLWVLPLALYLLTFVIAFDHPRWYHRTVFSWLLVASTGVAVWLIWKQTGDVPVTVLVAGLAGAMFVGCMVLHGELARLRPEPRRLTGYYLTIAAGGALGGLLVAVGAPLLLRSYSELQIALWVCCLLAYVTPLVVQRRSPSAVHFLFGVAGLTVLAVVLWASSHRTLPGTELRSSTRDFYGVITLRDAESVNGKGVLLQHSGTTHGHQFRRPSLRATPTTYYHSNTGVGLVLGEGTSPLPPGPRRVGLIGLGAGTLAAYARAGDVYRYYEINPSVVRVAREAFTYLGDAEARGATVEVVLGDGRLSLEREPAADQQFDVIVLDAFSGDAIPVHLLTLEAFELYRRHLKPDGVLCVHVSNHYLALEMVAGGAAARLGWPAVIAENDFEGEGRFPSIWALLGPDRATLAKLPRPGVEVPGAGGAPRRFSELAPASPDYVTWTDEHANVLRIVRPGKPEQP